MYLLSVQGLFSLERVSTRFFLPGKVQIFFDFNPSQYRAENPPIPTTFYQT
jgi:hypothetical protein